MKKLALAGVAVACAAAAGLAWLWCRNTPPDTGMALTTPAFVEGWATEVMANQNAGMLVVSAMIARDCDPAPIYAFYLDPHHRAVRDAARKRLLAIGGTEMDFVGMGIRSSRYAAAQLTAEERASLRGIVRDGELRSLYSTLEVLGSSFYGMNPTDGRMDALFPIQLKAYFVSEGTDKQLRAALAALSPKLAATFDRVGAASAHTSADAEWLSAFTGDLMGVWGDRLTEAYLGQFPEEKIGRLNAMYDHPFFEWLNKTVAAHAILVMRAAADTPEKRRLIRPDPETETIVAALEADARRVNRYRKIRLDGIGPDDIAGQSLNSICPRPSKIKPVPAVRE